jgi:hypothetical protein
MSSANFTSRLTGSTVKLSTILVLALVLIIVLLLRDSTVGEASKAFFALDESLGSSSMTITPESLESTETIDNIQELAKQLRETTRMVQSLEKTITRKNLQSAISVRHVCAHKPYLLHNKEDALKEILTYESFLQRQALVLKSNPKIFDAPNSHAQFDMYVFLPHRLKAVCH